MGERGAMTPNRHPKQSLRDHELDVWLEHALGVTRPEPEPVLHDLDD